MGIKAALSKIYALIRIRELRRWISNPFSAQDKVFTYLIKKAENTAFGKDHGFSEINNYEDFKKKVPIRTYEELKPYVDKVTNGEKDVLWPGKPLYLCKTSGTTSGAKYIPISRESIHHHINAARDAILFYIHETGKTNFVNGKMIFLQGSPEMTETSGIKTGRLSGIVAHHVPRYLQKNRLPSYETNCIDDWETKVEAVANETLKEKMTLISGIPPWVQMYFDVLLEKTGKKNMKEIFPDFSLFIYGGVNFEPYRAKFRETIGFDIDSIETYPASEGFIAFQDSRDKQGMLLLLNSGIFYEFVPAGEVFNDDPPRYSLEEVELGENYAIILNTDAGLWGYNIGDTVKFVSKDPYRLVVTGRIKHFTSAFGEHVIAEEVEKAMQEALEASGAEVVEFHVAPVVDPGEGKTSFHQWLVEFAKEPVDSAAFSKTADEVLQKANPYYKDLREGKMLRQLEVKPLKRGSFINYMRSEGKLGGQNKVPRLANDRNVAEKLIRV